MSGVVGRLCEVGTYFYNVDNSCVRTMLVRTGCGLDFPWETFQAIIPVILYRNIIVKKGKQRHMLFIHSRSSEKGEGHDCGGQYDFVNIHNEISLTKRYYKAHKAYSF